MCNGGFSVLKLSATFVLEIFPLEVGNLFPRAYSCLAVTARVFVRADNACITVIHIYIPNGVSSRDTALFFLDSIANFILEVHC